MPIDDPDVIDIIGVDEAKAEVILTISDRLEWDLRNEHLVRLQDKLNRYLAFIESGELEDTYAASVGRNVRIEVVCKYAPSEDGERFLWRAREIVEEAGFRFSWCVLTDPE